VLGVCFVCCLENLSWVSFFKDTCNKSWVSFRSVFLAINGSVAVLY